MNTVKNYFRFVAIEDSVIKLTGTDTETGESVTEVDIQYSMDGKNWTQYDYVGIPLAAEETLYIKGNNPNGLSIIDEDTGREIIYTFGDRSGRNNGSNGKFECHGNIMSLIYGDDFEGQMTIPSVSCFGYLFINCFDLITAPELPATNLTESCYNRMFSGCTSLIQAPELPATILAESCYYEMFRGCRSLKIVPSILPATILAESCYSRMFFSCMSLTTAPELPATTLANNCYYYMFGECIELTTAPELPATTLVEGCYKWMFYRCRSLNNITMLATDNSDNCLNNWVYGVAKTGVFIKHKDMTSLPSGSSGIPDNWTVIDYVV